MNNLPPVKNAPSLVTLDILRATAALLVVAEHARSVALVAYGALPAAQHTITTRALYLAARLGQEAVLVFFVLSGFLVGGQVIRRARKGRFDVRDYAIDRTTRILLPLVPAVLLAALAGYIWHDQPIDLAQIVGNSVGLNGIVVQTLALDAPLWSLAYEIWFYVIAGALAVVCITRGGIFAFAAAAAGLLAFCRLDASLILIWTLGAVVSCIEVRRHRGLLALAGIVLVVVGSAAIQLDRPSVSLGQHSLMTPAVGRGMFSVGFGMMVPWLVSSRVNEAIAGWGVIPRIASLLAGMSYTLYLFHYPLLDVIHTHVVASGVSVRSLGIYAASVAAALVFAIAMYWLFERNTDAVRRWAKRQIARPNPAAEQASYS